MATVRTDDNSKNVTQSERANLVFPVARCARLMRQGRYAERTSAR